MTSVFNDDTYLTRVSGGLLSELDVVRAGHSVAVPSTVYTLRQWHQNLPRPWLVSAHFVPQSRMRWFETNARIYEPRFVVAAHEQTISSRWFQPTITALSELVRLSPETHGDRGMPPDRFQVQSALAFFISSLKPNSAPPSLSPLNDGGIQAEWHRGGLDVEVLFSRDEDERGIYVREKETGEEQEFSLDSRAFVEAVGDRLSLAA